MQGVVTFQIQSIHQGVVTFQIQSIHMHLHGSANCRVTPRSTPPSYSLQIFLAQDDGEAVMRYR